MCADRTRGHGYPALPPSAPRVRGLAGRTPRARGLAGRTPRARGLARGFILIALRAQGLGAPWGDCNKVVMKRGISPTPDEKGGQRRRNAITWEEQAFAGAWSSFVAWCLEPVIKSEPDGALAPRPVAA